MNLNEECLLQFLSRAGGSPETAGRDGGLKPVKDRVVTPGIQGMDWDDGSRSPRQVD